MNYLLDTHALIWFIDGDQRLSARAKTLIEDGGNKIYFSVVSSFEMAIKNKRG